MFDAIKLTIECKSFLKKHNIPFCDDLNIYKRLGMIHCKVQDWRGPIELEGFPTLQEDEARFILLNYCLFEFYIHEELNSRDRLMKNYPKGYGEYDSRKYVFEKIIEVFKDYNDTYFNRAVKKYTKFLNTNSRAKFKWVYDMTTNCFTTTKSLDLMAVKVAKKTGSLVIYNMVPQQTMPNDNIFKYVATIKETKYIKFVFTNDGNDRCFLYVYNPKATEENDDYFLIGMADKIVWDYVWNDPVTIKRKEITYSYLNGKVKFNEDNLWKGNLQKKYNVELFYRNIEYVISFDWEPEIELYDKYANKYFLIAYKDFCDFYDKDGNYIKLNSIREIEKYVSLEDIVDIHDYGVSPSIDYSRKIEEQTIVADGKLWY